MEGCIFIGAVQSLIRKTVLSADKQVLLLISRRNI